MNNQKRLQHRKAEALLCSPPGMLFLPRRMLQALWWAAIVLGGREGPTQTCGQGGQQIQLPALPQREGMARLGTSGAGPWGWVEQFIFGWVSRSLPCAHKKQYQHNRLLDGWCCS